VPDIIRHWGYPAEIIPTMTPDGYLLTMHRIPWGKDGKKDGQPRPVVFLQHGLLASSSSWVTNLPHLSLGYMLADAGYDVCMGNVRGNLYSNQHMHLDPHGHAYWRFSWDEMVKYDLDAMIDTALSMTNQSSLYYVGHSQGTMIMFAKLASDPLFHSKIRKYFAIAPVSSVKYIRGLLAILARDFYGEFEFMYNILGEDQFLPSSWFISAVEKIICGNSQTNPLCGSLLFLIGGPESNQMNMTRLPVYLADEPAGTSTMNTLHWAQLVRNGGSAMWDYEDPIRNMLHYNQTTPPIYDLHRITNAEIYLYWSEADWLADTQDIAEHLVPGLAIDVLKENNHLHDFNHLDFIWGQRAADEVYTPILNILRADSKKN